MRCFRGFPILVLAVVSGVMTASVATALTAAPSTLRFESREDVAALHLTHDGAPVPGERITGWSLMVSGHRYDHMLRADIGDGRIVFRPSDTLEIGKYTLTIQTTLGSVEVVVDAPLNTRPNILEAEASRRGISVEQLRQELGLVTELAPRVRSLGVADEYYQGQTLRITVPRNEGSTYTWSIDGQVVAEGPDANTLRYTFTETGPRLITFSERRNDRVVATATTETTVAPTPAVPWQARQNAQTGFNGPDGYDHYTWLIDGEPVGHSQNLRHVFREPGEYMVECIATGGRVDGAKGFYRARFETTVTGS